MMTYYCKLYHISHILINQINIITLIVFRADYIAWNGANPDLCLGKRGLTKGPEAAMCSGRVNLAQGPNRNLCKGSKTELAKGSMISQFKVQQIAKCN